MKKFVHFNHASDFAKKKVSANAKDTAYRHGGVGEVISGTPDIKFSQIVFIKDTHEVFTHDEWYECADKGRLDKMEKVTAAALNDLNERLKRLESQS